MKETKWTQGPWKVLSNFPDEVEIVSPSRNGGPGKLVADLTVSAFDGEAIQANARLISKAPEMLEALSWFSEYAAQHPEWAESFLDHADSPEREWFYAVRSLLNAIQNGGEK